MSAVILPVLAAAVLGLPQPDREFMRDLPSGDRDAPMMVELLVAPDHAVDGCRVVSGASERQAGRICDRARTLTVPEVGTDHEGTPVHGFLYIARVPFSVRSDKAAIFPIDLHIAVTDIPGRAKSKTFSVTVRSDEGGSVTHCDGGTAVGQAFADAACAEARRLRLPVVQDRTGKPVSYVKYVYVQFLEDKPAAGG